MAGHFSLLVLIIALSIIVRVYHVDFVPSGVFPDEAYNGVDAYNALQNGNYRWFYPANHGREGLFINLIAVSFNFMGVSPLSLRLPSIFLGVLTVMGVYFLSRELFRSTPHLALTASYLTAVSFWAITFSRIAFRAILMLPIITFSLYFIFRGIRTKRYYNYALSGLIFGLGFHSYIAFRLFPVLLASLILLLFIQHHFKKIKYFVTSSIIFSLSALLTVFPILYCFYLHPEFIGSRTNSLSVFSQETKYILPTLIQNISLSLLKFNFIGDSNWRHGFPSHPTLNHVVGIFFAVGIIFSLIILARCLYQQLKQGAHGDNSFLVHGLLLSWFIVFLAPEFLTNEGIPHALRSIGVLPVVYIYSAFFLTKIIGVFLNKSIVSRVAIGLISVFLLTSIGLMNIYQYHVLWARNPKQADAFYKPLTDLALYIRELPRESSKYVVATRWERLTVELFNTHTPNLHLIYWTQIKNIDTSKDFFLLYQRENEVIENIMRSKSDVSVNVISTKLNSSFTVIKSVPPSS